MLNDEAMSMSRNSQLLSVLTVKAITGLDNPIVRAIMEKQRIKMVNLQCNF